jgi:presenilin 1
VKRILLVNEENGRVMEERRRSETDGDDHPMNNTIKLGLGDFIFYSLLVSKAALYSFTTFVACMLVVLGGLGGTLILLAVYRHALPALPISIFLGVLFYVLTRLLIEPWIQEIFKSPLYV